MTRLGAVHDALTKDGFYIKSKVTRKDGLAETFGLYAVNEVGVRLYYLTGDTYSRSYMLGALAPEAINAMCTTYLERIVPSFISSSLDRAIQEKTSLYWVKELLKRFAEWITAVTCEQVSENWQWYQEHMPAALVEVQALCDGVARSSPYGKTLVTAERVLALNFCTDVLMNMAAGRRAQTSFAAFLRAHLLEDHLPKLEAFLRIDSPHGTLDDLLRQGSPAACNSMAVRNERGVVSFCRDFQLPNGGVFQSTAGIFVCDSQELPNGRLEFYSGAPGILGGVTGMRFDGQHFLALGVNMFRAGLNVPCGIPASIVVGMTLKAPTATSAANAAAYISRIPRSAAWIYPIASDSDAGALEAGGRLAITTALAIEVARRGIASCECAEVLNERLPSQAFRCAFANGAVFRDLNYRDPQWLATVNEVLFAVHGHSATDPKPLPAPGPAIFGRLRKASDLCPMLGNNYFVPSRTPPGICVTSNDAVIPLMRLFQMGLLASAEELVSARSVQWRYDRAVDFAESLRNVATPSRAELEAVASFLSPVHFSPGEQYWGEETVPGKPMSAVLEGCISIVRGGERNSRGKLVGCGFAHKSGIWSLPFAWLSCSLYLLGESSESPS